MQGLRRRVGILESEREARTRRIADIDVRLTRIEVRAGLGEVRAGRRDACGEVRAGLLPPGTLSIGSFKRERKKSEKEE